MKRLRTPTTRVDAPTATARDGTVYHLLTSDQVQGIDGRLLSSGYVHVGCPIHGSDHQPSLHIQVADTDRRGFGRCHSCSAQVLVTDMNPEAAAHLTGKARGSAARARGVTAADMLRPPRRPVVSEPTPADWQREEMAALARWYPAMRARLADDRARAYLAERAIPWKIADAAGAAYMPADARLSGGMAKWRDRLIFPLRSPAGTGYYGRSLHGWEPARDVNEHADWLKGKPRALDASQRWLERAEGDVRAWGNCHEKTSPAGWWNYDALASASCAVLVEGVFDALALLADARLLGDVPVIALVGTAARPEWIPVTIASAILALDYDKPEARKAAAELKRNLCDTGLAVIECAPPDDGRGKDWAERWRLASHAGVWPVSKALDMPAGGSESMLTGAARVAPIAQQSVTATDDKSVDMPAAEEDTQPWLEDRVIRRLLVHGLELAEAYLLVEAPLQPALVE